MKTRSLLKFLKITAAMYKYKNAGARFLAKLSEEESPQLPETFRDLVLNTMGYYTRSFIAATRQYFTSDLTSIITSLLGGKKESAKIYEAYKKEIWGLLSSGANKQHISTPEFISRLLLINGETAKNADGFASVLVGYGVKCVATDEVLARKLKYLEA